MIKGVFFILVGFFIDGLQAAVSYMCFTLGVALQAATPVGGAVAGAAAGCAAGTTCIGGAVAGAAAGAAASAAGIPLGIVLGFALNVCISLTIGSAFVLLLSLNGMFYPSYIWPAFIGEAIPGLDDLPGWTLLAILCVLKNAKKKGGVTGLVANVAGVALNPTSAVGFAGGAVGAASAGISAFKQNTAGARAASPTMEKAYQSQPLQAVAETRQNLRANVGQELRTAPRTSFNQYVEKPAV